MENNKKMNGKDRNLWSCQQTKNREHLIAGHPRQSMLYKEIKKISKTGKILEIGFGDGFLLDLLSDTFTCFGADISKENVNQASKKNKDISFNIIDVDGKLPYEDNFFDFFIASEVLEHMSDKELIVVINEIGRILKSGGYAFITFPVNEDLKENKCFCPNCKFIFHRWGHKQSFDSAKIKEMFGTFEIVKNKIFFTPIKKVQVSSN